MSEPEDTSKPDVQPQSQSKQKKFGRYWTGAHTKHRLRSHLVWIPKYRKRVLTGQVAVRLEALLRQACEVNGWEVQEIAIQPDHVHLLVQVQARDSVPAVMKVLKGGTSRVLRQSLLTWQSICMPRRALLRMGQELLGRRVLCGNSGRGGGRGGVPLHSRTASIVADGNLSRIESVGGPGLKTGVLYWRGRDSQHPLPTLSLGVPRSFQTRTNDGTNRSVVAHGLVRRGCAGGTPNGVAGDADKTVLTRRCAMQEALTLLPRACPSRSYGKPCTCKRARGLRASLSPSLGKGEGENAAVIVFAFHADRPAMPFDNVLDDA